MNKTLPLPQAVLFDLDGTLADTAPDLAGAINRLQRARGLSETPYEKLRTHSSGGARGLIGASFGLKPGDEGYEELRLEFLDSYAKALAVDSCLFDGVSELLDTLRERGLQWGIVTNKTADLTDRLVPQIGLDHAGCVISGDTTPHPKPHPAPLLEAAKRLGLAPETCWYVGDDLRDIRAGKAAGMPTIAAGWGYCGVDGPGGWDAEALADQPLDLLELLSRARA